MLCKLGSFVKNVKNVNKLDYKDFVFKDFVVKDFVVKDFVVKDFVFCSVSESRSDNCAKNYLKNCPKTNVSFLKKKTQCVDQSLNLNNVSIINDCEEFFLKDGCLAVQEKKEKILTFNKVRNDKRHRKQAFQKRGYWKKMHYFTKKNNMMW